jgi:DNA-binding transcriptional LysR family regulator
VRPNAGYVGAVDVQRLETAIALAEHGTVNAAAAAMGLAPSSVSDRVRQLEADLGAAVFIRSSRGMRLTPAGARLLEDVKPLLASLRSLMAAFSDNAPALVVGALPALTVSELQPVLDGFSAQFPHQDLQLRPEPDRGQLLRLLTESAVDAVVLLDTGDALGRLGFTPPSDLEYLDLRDVPLVLVAAPTDPLTAGPVTAARLRESAVLLGQEHRCSYWMATQHWLGSDTPLTAVGGIPQIKQWVQQGRGVALLPDFAVREELDAGTMTRLHIDTPPLQMRLVWRHGEDSSRPALRNLLYAISTP